LDCLARSAEDLELVAHLIVAVALEEVAGIC
jgi:hypothetical protein